MGHLNAVLSHILFIVIFIIHQPPVATVDGGITFNSSSSSHISNNKYPNHLKNINNLTSTNINHHVNNNKRCLPDDYRYGQWIEGAQDNCGLLTDYNEPEPIGTNRKINPVILQYQGFSNWCWKPLHCHSEAFNREVFCRRLAGRNILMVGDSLQHLFYLALKMQLDPSGKVMAHDCNDDCLVTSKDKFICGGNSTLVYRSNVQLRLEPQQGLTWHHLAKQSDIVILNKAAHHVPFEVFEKDTKETAIYLARLMAIKPSMIVFYRTSSPGHAKATNESRPDTAVLRTEPLWLNLSGTTAAEEDMFVKGFLWDSFPVKNRIASDIFSTYLGLTRFIPLHVAEMTVLRPDGHLVLPAKSYDGLHYYLPSVVDNWVLPLYNLLPPL